MGNRYNAELSPAELRGSLVSLQQLAITFGIMVSYWIGELSMAVHAYRLLTYNRIRHELHRRNWPRTV